jgi:hypothetical protein
MILRDQSVRHLPALCRCSTKVACAPFIAPFAMSGIINIDLRAYCACNLKNGIGSITVNPIRLRLKYALKCFLSPVIR